MTDHGPDDTQEAFDPIDYSGQPRSLGAQRDEGFRLMKAKLMEHKLKKIQHMSPMLKGAALKSYEEGLNDAFYVFAQVVDVPTEDELSAG